jgi:transglutaminase-like putative cysteine protease
LFWSVAVFAGGLLLHVDRLPLWSTLLVLGCAAWRLAAEVRSKPLPRKLWRALLAVGGAMAVLLSFRTLNGLSAGTTLLALMGGLKLLETRSRRDRYIVIGAGLFLLLAACLDRQHLTRLPLYVAQAWLACAALAIVASDSRGLGIRPAFALAGRSLLLAVPLALLLFLLFPRVAGSFWALPQRGQAVTGLGDEMSPGSIVELTDSGDVAFRAKFLDAIPPPEERYWRGPVLHDFDGYTWRRSRATPYRHTPLEYLGRAYRYRLTLEPHSRRWWFALDTPTGSPDPRVLFTSDHQLVSLEAVTESTSYALTSHTRTRATAPLSTLGRRYGTQLPAERNRRSRALAVEMRGAARSDGEYARAVLELFRTGGFEYTLTPPRTDFDFVDDFLFETRRGFCGHFASAFVAMMRAGGVPARVVTGYLGGEWNPIGGYFIVRQSDAHAWAEVWLEGRGWTRIDPTAVVAPERLQMGLLDLMPGSASAPRRLLHENRWLSQAALTWDAIDSWWREQVIQFDFRSQLELLDAMGFEGGTVRALVGLLGAGLALWILWIGWHLRGALRRSRHDALARAWLRLCRKLASIAPRAAHEGPLAYAQRIGELRPALAPSVRKLATEYAELRFGAAVRDRARIESFRRAVAYFRAT